LLALTAKKKDLERAINNNLFPSSWPVVLRTLH
jgi:hypothetical protein